MLVTPAVPHCHIPTSLKMPPAYFRSDFRSREPYALLCSRAEEFSSCNIHLAGDSSECSSCLLLLAALPKPCSPLLAFTLDSGGSGEDFSKNSGQELLPTLTTDSLKSSPPPPRHQTSLLDFKIATFQTSEYACHHRICTCPFTKNQQTSRYPLPREFLSHCLDSDKCVNM